MTGENKYPGERQKDRERERERERGGKEKTDSERESEKEGGRVNQKKRVSSLFSVAVYLLLLSPLSLFPLFS